MDPFAAKWVTSFVACLWRGGGGVDVHRSGLASVSKHFHEPNLEAWSSHTYIFGSQAFFIRKTWQLCSRASEAAGFPFGRLSSAVCYSPHLFLWELPPSSSLTCMCICLYVRACADVCAHTDAYMMHAYIGGSQRTSCRLWFLPSLWVAGTALRSQGLAEALPLLT